MRVIGVGETKAGRIGLCLGIQRAFMAVRIGFRWPVGVGGDRKGRAGLSYDDRAVTVPPGPKPALACCCCSGLLLQLGGGGPAGCLGPAILIVSPCVGALGAAGGSSMSSGFLVKVPVRKHVGNMRMHLRQP